MAKKMGDVRKRNARINKTCNVKNVFLEIM